MANQAACQPQGVNCYFCVLKEVLRHECTVGTLTLGAPLGIFLSGGRAPYCCSMATRLLHLKYADHARIVTPTNFILTRSNQPPPGQTQSLLSITLLSMLLLLPSFLFKIGICAFWPKGAHARFPFPPTACPRREQTAAEAIQSCPVGVSLLSSLWVPGCRAQG